MLKKLGVMFKIHGVIISYTWELAIFVLLLIGFGFAGADLLGKLLGLEK